MLPGASRPLIKQPSSVSSDGEASQDGERLIMYDICNFYMNKVIIIIIIIKPRRYWWYPGWRPNMVKVKEALCILSFWFDDFQKRSLPLHGDWIITRVHIIFVVECLCKIWTFYWKDNIVARNTQYSYFHGK